MIYLCIRQTVDWADERAFRAQLPREFAPTVDLWDATFDLPHHRFRQGVREIAIQNANGMTDVRMASWDDIPDGSLVLPADDDDWFYEDIARALGAARAREPQAVCYRWPEAFLEVPLNLAHRIRLLQRRLFGTGPRWYCSTNNYAVVKSSETRPLFENHMLASAWCGAHPDRVAELSSRLSVMNRTLASRTSLGMGAPRNARPITRTGLLRRYHDYRRLYERPLAEDIGWCAPWARQMRDLMGRLRLA